MNHMTNFTQKKLEEFEKLWDSIQIFSLEADWKKSIKDFLSESIEQAMAEERARHYILSQKDNQDK